MRNTCQRMRGAHAPWKMCAAPPSDQTLLLVMTLKASHCLFHGD